MISQLVNAAYIAVTAIVMCGSAWNGHGVAESLVFGAIWPLIVVKIPIEYALLGLEWLSDRGRVHRLRGGAK